MLIRQIVQTLLELLSDLHNAKIQLVNVLVSYYLIISFYKPTKPKDSAFGVELE